MTPNIQTNTKIALILRQKRAKRSIFRSVSMLVKNLKNHSKNYFFTMFTSFCILAILFTSLTNNVTYSTNNLKTQSAELLASVSDLLKTDPDEIEQNLDEIEKMILNNFQPLLSFLNLDTRQDFTKIKNLINRWLQAIKPLQNYQLTVNGLINLTNENILFTDELEIFFNQLKNELIPETQKLWSEFAFYVNLAKISGVAKIITLENLLENVLNLATILTDYQKPILDILGHFSKQKIVIFNQNIGESRPTGGFIGSFISIDTAKGRIHINESNSIYSPDGSIQEKLYMHPATAYYTWSSNPDFATDHGIRNSNFLPCFPETASILHQGFLASSQGYPIDLMMFITPQFLLDILGPNFSFEVPGVGLLNSSNIMDRIEWLTGIEYTDATNPKKDIQAILETLLREIPQIIKQKSPLDWLDLILQAINSRDLQIWSNNSSAQDLFNQTGITNQALCNQSPIPEIGFISGNISADKRGNVTENQFNIYSKKTTQGNEIYVKYKQIIPQNPDLPRGFNRDQSFTFTGLQIPTEATNLNVHSPQAIYTPFLRPYYEKLFEMNFDRSLTQLSQISYIVKNSKNLYSTTGNPPGFVYQHQNGSQVLGIYINDWDTVAEVEFSFVLPKDFDVIKFYGQPGLRLPSLGLGDNLSFVDTPTRLKSTNNYYKIHSGMLIQIE